MSIPLIVVLVVEIVAMFLPELMYNINSHFIDTRKTEMNIVRPKISTLSESFGTDVLVYNVMTTDKMPTFFNYTIYGNITDLNLSIDESYQSSLLPVLVYDIPDTFAHTTNAVFDSKQKFLTIGGRECHENLIKSPPLTSRTGIETYQNVIVVGHENTRDLRMFLLSSFPELVSFNPNSLYKSQIVISALSDFEYQFLEYIGIPKSQIVSSDDAFVFGNSVQTFRGPPCGFIVPVLVKNMQRKLIKRIPLRKMPDQYVIIKSNFPDFDRVWDSVTKAYPKINWTTGPSLDDLETNVQFWSHVQVLITARSEESAFASFMPPESSVFEVHYENISQDLMTWARYNQMNYYTTFIDGDQSTSLDPAIVREAVEQMFTN